MEIPKLTCQDKKRRHEVRASEQFNGLDYLETYDDNNKPTLVVYFLDKLGEARKLIEKENVLIEGGRRVTNIKVVNIDVCVQEDPERDDCMQIWLDKYGDSSIYKLCLVEVDEYKRPIVEGKSHGHKKYRPLRGFDPRYACLDFSFTAGCPSDLDCKPMEVCPPPEREEPEINYLAKDYASFRQLILDRLALIMPDWDERHVPDLGIALVELLAYVGDHLSYHQDAVATEAYLDTARQRISVRRHARLVDYHMHEGCNARAWIFVETPPDPPALKSKNIFFITGKDLRLTSNILTVEDLRGFPTNQYEVFEPVVEFHGDTIQFYEAHNRIRFYTWGDQECCLPRGATSATLIDEWVFPEESEGEGPEEQQQKRPKGKNKVTNESTKPVRKLHLKEGDILIFEEVTGPKTGNEADADPTRRHAVSLIRAEPREDPLYKQPEDSTHNQPIVEIEWAEKDALPFPFCISTIAPAPECELLEDVSVARGNVILVDHGRSLDPEDLGVVKERETRQICEGEGRPSDVEILPARFQAVLRDIPLTFSEPLPSESSALRLLTRDPRQALPQIKLAGTLTGPDGDIINQWTAQRDLLGSHQDDRHFVVEIDNEGRAHLRFGDGELGQMPEVGTTFTATYRVGNGPVGNVGAEAISHIVFRSTKLSGVKLQPRNPMPASGGTSPEPLDEAKLFAPHSFRTILQRAITAEDYAKLIMRNFKDRVQRAAATLRWTGSWYEVLVAIDPRSQMEATQDLLEEIKGHLYRFRRIGHDVRVAEANYVPLDIEMTICVLPNYLRGHVKAALLELFSNRRLPDGRLGFFHPDNLTFGEGILLSKLIAVAQAIPGVENVTVTKLERLFEGPNKEIEEGILPLGPLEVARLDNDPSFPENGQLKLDMRGGR